MADVDSVGKYTTAEAFAGLDVGSISSATTAQDWADMARKADEIREAAGDAVKPAATQDVEKAEGGSQPAEAVFRDLHTGMYLIVPAETYNSDYSVKYVFTPYLTALPGNPYATGGGTGDDAYGTGEDRWEYDTTIGLKAAAEPQVGKLTIMKTLSNFNETLGRVSFVFEVIGRDTDGTVVYKNIISTTHDTADTQSVTLENIPAGCYVTVTEVYDGPSYTFDSPTVVSDLLIWSDAAIAAKEAGEGSAAIADAAIPVAPFTNRYDEGNRGGYGVTNQFERDEDGGWSWSTSIPVTPAPEAE